MPTLDVFWEAPLDDGGSPVTTYTVTGGPVERQVTGTTVRLTDLDPDLQYTIAVTATNAEGTGAAEQTAHAVSPRVEVAAGTVVLTPPSLAKLRRVLPGIVEFESGNTQIAAMKVGDILVGDRTDKAPTGFLRRADEIFRVTADGGIQVATSDVELDQGVPRGEAAISDTLDAADVASVRSTRPGVRMAQGVGGSLGRVRGGGMCSC